MLPEVAAALGDDFPVLVDTAVSVFDGENLLCLVLAQPPLEERRLALLATLLRSVAGHSRQPVS